MFLFLSSGSAQDRPSSGELIVSAWQAHGKKDVETTFSVTQQLIDLYKDEANKQQSFLKKLPKNKEEIEEVASLNDVATAYFIQGESYRNQSKNAEAIETFRIVVDRYCCAQAWDPRGWYWQIAKAAQESIAKLKPGESKDLDNCKCAPTTAGGVPDEDAKVPKAPTKLALYDAGKSAMVVPYEKFGEFRNIGTKDYIYVVKDQEGLAQAVGEGIFPNTTSIRWDPELKKAQKEGRLDGSLWHYLQSPDLEAAFLKWVTASEPAGVRLYYTALVLEKAGLLQHAIKCYYAIVVHFPGAYGKTYWNTPWYVGQAAIAKIHTILRQNPKLGFRLVDADIKIINGYDNDVSNDSAVVNPGRFEKVRFMDKFKRKPAKDLLSFKRRLGKGKVHLVQYETGDWELLVNGKPYVIQAVTYAPTKVGQSPDEGTMTNWMEDDFNANGLVDGPYDAFVDKNRNNRQDKNERAQGDFKLMKQMKVNTIRLYHHPQKPDKEVLRDLYERFGIRVIMGDFLGKYAIGSGAPWNPGTDYTNEEHKKNMMQSVIGMVMEYKDEPFILFWLLGNENVYGYACNADKKPDAFFSFANEVAQQIKAIDPDHPVAICSGDVLYLDRYGKFTPDIDIFGTNAYRGDFGFGRLWRDVQEETNKPVFITEFGCPAYAKGRSEQEAEYLQASYHQGSWNDISANMAFGSGAGNALGGVVFQWLDEWWKAYEPSVHDTRPLWAGPFPDGYMHEEWLGLCGQGDGTASPFLRQLRKSYEMYRRLWK
ncbi:MAG: hypothetical protein KBA46_02440 [Candidatus Omnitrophica bacterium]|nr:hypothetical protein [Candidatus Omnitrophota bacterium]